MATAVDFGVLQAPSGAVSIMESMTPHHWTMAMQNDNSMKPKGWWVALWLVALVSLGSGAAAAKKVGSEVALNPIGEKLFAKYSGMLKSLQEQIGKSAPQTDQTRSAVFLKTHAAEALAKSGPDAIAALARAQTATLTAATPILAEMESFLMSDKLDARLIRCAVLANATPRGLAEFAQQGKDEQSLVESLLANDNLMKLMLEADGAKAGKYARATQIYSDIQKASQQASTGILQRLALGTSLELTVPLKGEVVVDPVKRYLEYEKAYLNGELDPAFKNMTTWECRMITNAPETNEELAWGREMLRNYRPDIIFEPDYRWRYSKIVKTDVTYKNPEWEPGASSLKMQQLVNGGGKCGPRAWFGRFALRSFGIPVWGVQQTGHAALSHWTPQGWTVNFGAHWRNNWWEDRSGEEFLLETQAREYPKEYAKVLRAQWVGDALGETKVDGRRPGQGGLWNALALNQKRAMVAAAKPAEVALAGEELAESNVSSKAEAVMKAEVTAQDKKIVIGKDGAIAIPAVACSIPRNNTANILFMKSFSGGMQLHHRQSEAFEYAFDAPAAGKYSLTARVVTVHKDQHLLLATNGSKAPLDIAVPYTIGSWQETEPVAIELTKGGKVLSEIGKHYPGAQKYEIAGFVWWQGHKDQNPVHASRYEPVDSERAQHGDGFGELGGRAGGFEARKAPPLQQNVIAVAVEHQALAGNLHGGDLLTRGQRFDAGDFQQIGGGVGQSAEAVAPRLLQGLDGLVGGSLGEFAVGGDAHPGVLQPASRQECRQG